MMMIDLNEKLEKYEEKDCYSQCMAIYRNHVMCMEYNAEENGSVIITTDAGIVRTYNCTIKDFEEIQKSILEEKCIMIINNLNASGFQKLK